MSLKCLSYKLFSFIATIMKNNSLIKIPKQSFSKYFHFIPPFFHLLQKYASLIVNLFTPFKRNELATNLYCFNRLVWFKWFISLKQNVLLFCLGEFCLFCRFIELFLVIGVVVAAWCSCYHQLLWLWFDVIDCSVLFNIL